ncbi:hypothetical protein MPH_01040 [Macrophomina phaseolina MS6]|uniref:Uncharacterized protein n=1 Tax=Macrophomina phaseolina (strain MS6) TaxID=1126212 RepID=K2RGE9_MACPH|nr:hypothetical protein MPH_01040 [Macrophomina phaseolina MS6]
MSLNCYSPTKRRVASPKKSSVTKSPDKEKPYAALDETQRSHAYRYNIGNNFYREQVDRDNATKTQSSSPDKKVFADALCEKSLPPEPETDSAPGTTVTTFMMQMNQPEFGQRQAPFRLVPETDEEALPTTRALIESRSETRLLRMMAQKTEISKYHTPPPYDSDDDTPPNAPRPLSSKDIPHKRKVSVPESTKTSFPNGSQSEKSLRHKSAKPPLGVDSPQGSASTSTSSNETRPAAESQHQIPTKAAKILGTSTSTGNHSAGSKWVLNLHRRKTQKGHANATSSLPKQVHELNEEDITALPSTLLTSNSAEPNRNISFGGTTRVAIDNSFSNRYQRLVREESDVTLPPTPPAKDTPPHIKDALTALPQEDPDHLAGLGINTAEDNDEVSNMDFAKDAVNGSKSESALFKHGAAEHAKLIHASPSLYSMQASVVGSRRGSKEHTLLPDGVRLSRQHDGGLTKEGYLPPTLYSSDQYSPSIYSPVFKTAETIDVS